jgi:hypothetical protein
MTAPTVESAVVVLGWPYRAGIREIHSALSMVRSLSSSCITMRVDVSGCIVMRLPCNRRVIIAK